MHERKLRFRVVNLFSYLLLCNASSFKSSSTPVWKIERFVTRRIEEADCYIDPFLIFCHKQVNKHMY